MPKTSPLMLAIDIGNSILHSGVVDTGNLRCVRRADLPHAGTRGQLPRLLERVISPATERESPLARAVIAGGGGGMARQVRALLKEFDITDVANLSWHAGLPVRFRYKKLQSLGADRIADALYAAAAYPKCNSIIIDAGTAVTVDALTAQGEFMGGVIFPGPSAQLRGLHEAAPALPMIDIMNKSNRLPGTSTEECMRSGVLHAVAGALDHFVNKYLELLSGNCVVLSTGGGWEFVKKYVGFKSIEVRDMTLIGTAMFASQLESL